MRSAQDPNRQSRQQGRACRGIMLAGALAFVITGAAAAQEIPFLAAPGAPAAAFPKPTRPAAGIISPIWHTAAERDAADESGQVARLLGIKPGMAVGDIGAGSGYYTVRLSRLVGPQGRVIAQDITPAYLAILAARVRELALSNVTIGRGQAHDPRLPAGTLDAALMVHMYHEIAQPYALLHNLVPALKPGARLAIVDLDAPIMEHGTPPALLRCELAAAGFQEIGFHRLKGSPTYLAIFTAPAAAARKPPGAIVPCH
jgi:predicted methyltransferase